MNTLSKEELEKELEKLSPEEKLEFLRHTNKAIKEMNEAMGEFIQKTEE